MSVTYVNVGQTCTAFAEQMPQPIIKKFLVSSDNKVLRQTQSSGPIILSPPSGFVDLGSNALAVNDLLVDLMFSEDVAFGNSATGLTPQPNGRILKSNAFASVPLATTSNVVNVSGSSVTYQDTTYSIQDETYSTSGFTNLVSQVLPCFYTTGTGGSPPVVGINTPFYLYKYTPTSSTPVHTGNVYLGSDITEKDINLANVLSTDAGRFSFRITTENNRVVYKIQNNSVDVNDLIVNYRSDVIPKFYVSKGATTYCLDTRTPSVDLPFISYVTTLIKISSKFLTLESIYGTKIILKEYWSSGLTKSQITERMMFYWRDLTPFSPLTPTPGSKEDIYMWGILDSTAPVKSDGTKVYRFLYVDTNGILVNSDTVPPLNEGWALTTDYNSLLYKRGDTEIGYISLSTDNLETISYVNLPPGGSIPSTSNVFTCVKCTTNSEGLCNPL